MRIHIINNLYSLNRGWALLVISVTDFLLKRNPKISFTIESIFPEIDGRVYHGCKCVVSVKSSLKVFLSSLLRAFSWRLLGGIGVRADHILNVEPLRHYWMADVILDLSGDGFCPAEGRTLWYLARRWISTLTNLACIVIALLLHKPVILYSQSIGNLDPLLRGLVKLALNSRRVMLIAVRDTRSKLYLEGIGVDGRKIMLIGDASLSILAPNNLPREPGDIFGFCISVEAASHFYNMGLETFMRVVGKVFKYIESVYSGRVLIVPFSLGGRWRHENELEMLLPIFKDSGVNFLQEKTFNLNDLFNALSKCRVFVAARMHAAIIALLCNVPTIIIAHSPKLRGLAEWLGCQDLVIDSDKVGCHEICSKIDYIMRNYEPIRAKIGERIVRAKAASIEGLNKLFEVIQRVAVR